MTIGVIGAMSIEVDTIKALLDGTETEIVSGIEFVVGKLKGKTVVAAQCGVGKVFSAMCAEAMILNFKPDVILNIGVAGSLSDKLSIGDIAIADSVVQHDYDTSTLDNCRVGTVSGLDIVNIPCDGSVTAAIKKAVDSLSINNITGTIVSGDQFINSGEKKEWLKSYFGGIACEMEGGSIGHVCYVNGVKFSVLRAVSDSADGSSHMDFPVFAKKAAENSAAVFVKFAEIY